MAAKKKNKNKLFKAGLLNTRLYRLASLFLIKERLFLVIVLSSFFIAGIFFPYPHIAMWIGFIFAAYSAIANDSIQTIGTFLVSNAHRKWYILWLFIGGIFVLTSFYSWYNFNGDVSYQRLLSKGFDKSPDSFAFLQVAAPIFLLILTRMRMPVSTTFLLLSAFSAESSGIIGMMTKSVSGYFIAFASSFLIWSFFDGAIKRFTQKPAHKYWSVAQWVISGSLWSVWIMQDAANIAVFLPRSLDLVQYCFFAGLVFAGLGILFFLRGDKIQKIVNEKTEIADVRTATIVDFIYAIILFIFKNMSSIPMSTTWVFIGLLGGREIAMNIIVRKKTGKQRTKVLKMVWRDVLYAIIGLTISIMLAIAVNRSIQLEIWEFLKTVF
jgi:hypothetical protein